MHKPDARLHLVHTGRNAALPHERKAQVGLRQCGAIQFVCVAVGGQRLAHHRLRLRIRLALQQDVAQVVQRRGLEPGQPSCARNLQRLAVCRYGRVEVALHVFDIAPVQVQPAQRLPGIQLLRQGQRLADGLQRPLRVLHVEMQQLQMRARPQLCRGRLARQRARQLQAAQQLGQCLFKLPVAAVQRAQCQVV